MLGLRIREARLARGLSQAQLAEGKFSRSYIGAIESSKTKPSAENLMIIAERLGKPLTYFIPDERDILSTKLEVKINQAKGLIEVNELTQAQALFEECRCMYDQALHPRVRGLFLELSADLERSKGSILKSVEAYKAAAGAYHIAGLVDAAWKCRYSAAMYLYHAGHLSYAVFVALEALDTLTANEGLVDELRKTHYLIGCCYAALSNNVSAQSHFALAEEVGSQTTETGIKALIAKASCYGREDDWPNALKEAQKAAALADKRHSATLKAEALLGACVCLVNMKDTARVGRLLAELTNTPQVTVATKRKAYREVILALSELSLTQESLQYEHELRILLLKLDDTEEWEQVKDNWALTKCDLLREPKNVKEIGLSFSQSFISHMRYRDAAEVLIFSARLLEQQNQPQEALHLMKSACQLLKGKP